MAEQQNPMADRLEAAAATLTAGHIDGGPDADKSSLLRYLGYDDGNTAYAQGRARMLRAAARFRRLFVLPVPDAPGLIFFGGEADPSILGPLQEGLPIGYLAGSGLSPQRAFEACVGEGIEYLSQFVQADDAAESGSLAEYGHTHDAHTKRFISEVFAVSNVDAGRSIAWVPARRLTDGLETWLPLDLCCRRPASQQDFKPPLKLSTGCAAGPAVEAATLHALLELIERDAVALWWRGGRRGRAIAPDSEAGRAAEDLLGQVRQGRADRKSWLLDITTDLGINAVAAVSARTDGYGFAFGAAARLSRAEATRAAIFELCQAELGHHVVAAKRYESGDSALNESDLRRLRLGRLFDTRNCALLQPESGLNSITAEMDTATGLQYVLDRLAACGIAAYTLVLTRPQFGIPVVRAITPGLQLEPCQIVGARLARALRETGGGGIHHGGLPLL
jgi:ribosomal protein S12 methylthiotransferase accessory factor